MMGTLGRMKYLTMLLFCAALIGCANNDLVIKENDQAADVAFVVDTSNESALKLIEYLNNSQSSKDAFHELIQPYSPYFELVRSQMTSMYGFCFTVPFGDKEKNNVVGAIYYPVEFQQSDGDRICLGEKLGVPHRIDGVTLHRDIDYKQRFLYSYYFNKLKGLGIPVDTSLISYMYLLTIVR